MSDHPEKAQDLDAVAAAYFTSQKCANLEDLVQAAEGLVHHFARTFSRGPMREDLLQAGQEGLMKAIERYDPSKAASFATYAAHCIIGEIRHEIRREKAFDRPHWMIELQEKILAATEKLAQEYSRTPSIEEIAREVNIKEEGVIEAMQAGSISFEELSLSKIRSLHYENFRLPIEDVITIREAVRRLDEIQREVVYFAFYQDLTQTEIAKRLGLTQRKVSRVLKRALASLKSKLSK